MTKSAVGTKARMAKRKKDLNPVYLVNLQQDLAQIVLKPKPTSNDVPIKINRCSSVHVVGTGTAEGSILTYSVQGLETPTLKLPFEEVRVICMSRNSMISPLVDWKLSEKHKAREC